MIEVQVPNITIDTVKMIAFIAQKIYDKVLDNIKRGLNNDGEPFISYEPKYAAKKGGKVDLKDTGRMLSQLKLKIGNNKIQIAVIGNRAEVAFYLNQHKNWQFMEWGITLEQAYQDAVVEYVQKSFNGERI